MSMQSNIFVQGKQYRVKRDYTKGQRKFISGEILTFHTENFSPYDDCFVFFFHDKSGATREWWVSVDDADNLTESWEEVFEPLS